MSLGTHPELSLQVQKSSINLCYLHGQIPAQGIPTGGRCQQPQELPCPALKGGPSAGRGCSRSRARMLPVPGGPARLWIGGSSGAPVKGRGCAGSRSSPPGVTAVPSLPRLPDGLGRGELLARPAPWTVPGCRLSRHPERLQEVQRSECSGDRSSHGTHPPLQGPLCHPSPSLCPTAPAFPKQMSLVQTAVQAGDRKSRYSGNCHSRTQILSSLCGWSPWGPHPPSW